MNTLRAVTLAASTMLLAIAKRHATIPCPFCPFSLPFDPRAKRSERAIIGARLAAHITGHAEGLPIPESNP